MILSTSISIAEVRFAYFDRSDADLSAKLSLVVIKTFKRPDIVWANLYLYLHCICPNISYTYRNMCIQNKNSKHNRIKAQTRYAPGFFARKQQAKRNKKIV